MSKTVQKLNSHVASFFKTKLETLQQSIDPKDRKAVSIAQVRAHIDANPKAAKAEFGAFLERHKQITNPAALERLVDPDAAEDHPLHGKTHLDELEEAHASL